MPFLVPVIAGAVGAGVVGEALIGLGLSVAMAAGARALSPKPRDQDSAGRGMRLTPRLDPNAPREVVVGTAAVAGTLVYQKVFGTNADYIDLVYALSDCPCEGLGGLYINGQAAGRHDDTGLVDGFPGMEIHWFGGGADQTASSLLAADGGTWSSTHVGRGVAYVHVRMAYSATLYQTGLPRFLFVVRGAKLYDWRKDTTAGGSGAHRWGQPATYEWSDNPAVILYNYRRGFRVDGQVVVGMNTAATALPFDDWTAAANACDELVALKAGGTEKRYRASGVLSSAAAHRENITDLITAMAGREITSGGVVRPIAGVTQASVMSFTDDDIAADTEVRIRGRKPRSELVNAVFGSYHDPGQLYESVAAPPRVSPDDEATDGGIQLSQHYALDYVTSQTQAQRVLEILRRRERNQTEVRLTLRPRFAVLEAGDCVTWTSDRYGFAAQQFEVASVAVGADWSAILVLRQTSPSVCAWTPATDELDPLAPATVSPGASAVTSVAGLAIETITVAGGTSSSRPGLRLTWTPITDPSVVQLEIETRRHGDAGAGTLRRVYDPASGQHAWVDGIQGGLVYEARVRPVTAPAREVAWSAWIWPASSTPAQVVEVGTLVAPPHSIGPEQLDAQTAFELSLTTQTEDVLGSAGWIDAQQIELANAAGEAALRALVAVHAVGASVRTETLQRQGDTNSLASQITTVLAGLATANGAIAGNAAAISTLQGQVTSQGSQITAQANSITALSASIDTEHATNVAQATAVSALQTTVTSQGSQISAQASSLSTLSTTVGGHTTSIAQHQTSIDGIRAQWGIVIATDGAIIGAIRLDAAASQSAFTVDASTFQVRQSVGGTPVPVFAVATVNGVTKLALRGDMIADGAIFARSLSVTSLDAISANFGTMTSGRWLSPDGKLDINAPAGGSPYIRMVA